MTLRPAVVARLVRSVDDLQTAAPELGWPEATALADVLVDRLAHLLVDRAAGSPRPGPGPGPAVLPPRGVAGTVGSADHASCRAAAGALRRAAAELAGATPGRGVEADAVGWARVGAEVADGLAELLDRVADVARSRGLRATDRAVVVRRLHALGRRLDEAAG